VTAVVTMPANGFYSVLTTGLDNNGRVRYLETTVRVGAAAAGVRGVPSGTVRVHAAADTADADSSVSALSVTGANVGPVMLAGLVLMATGLVLVVTTTRRRWRTAAKRR
jgi:hypothetical protein